MKKIIKIITIMLLGVSLSLAQSLDDFYKGAAENNPALQAKYLQFKIALQKVPQAKSLSDPQLSFGYFISPVETRVGPQNMRFSLTQMFPWFGTLKAQGNAAALMADAQYQDFLEARNSLYYQVAAAYYPLFELDQWKRIEMKNRDILVSYKILAEQKFRNGGNLADVLRVDLMLNESNTNLSLLAQKEKPLLTAFNAFLNRPENEAVIISDTSFLKISADSKTDKTDFGDHPSLRGLDIKIEAAEVLERIARKQGLPKIGIGLDYVVVGERTDAIVTDNGKDVIMPMISFSLPLYRAKYKAIKREARLQTESFVYQKRELANALNTRLEASRFDIAQNREHIALYEKQIQESSQILDLLFIGYTNSGKDLDEVLQMQQQLLTYKKNKISALKQYWIAVSKLDYITARNSSFVSEEIQ